MARGVNKLQAKAFWSKVEIGEPSKCWNWTGAKKPKGYGNLRIDRVYKLAHRVAWELTNFEIPSNYVIMHLCDNPSCCNPSHLVLGTSQSNNCDKLIKGRSSFHKNKAIGERNANAKFTEQDIRDIRLAYQGKTRNQYELADLYAVSQPTIGCIVRRQTWRHVA